MSIINIKARQILDSRGNPTVQVDLTTQIGIFRASVPSGASTGKYQALELRDQNINYFLGKGVLKAVQNVNKIIAPALLNKDVTKQFQLDKFMVESLDGTLNQFGWCKSKLGANSILAVSLAIAKAGAATKKLKLYQYIRYLTDQSKNQNNKKFIMPCPAFNLINGGKHGGNGLSIQQFMIFPTGANNFSHALQIGTQIYHHLMKLIKKKYGLQATNVGDEGGFAPNVNTGKQALDLLIQAIQISGHKGLVQIGMDCAASQFYDQKTKTYDLNFKNQELSKKQKWLTSEQLKNLYVQYTKMYPITSIQDPFDQDDAQGWKAITSDLQKNGIQIVGDDLLVTNKKRIQKSIKQKQCSALLLKVNQIGSLTQAIQAWLLSKQNGWGTMVSHRSGQTEDTFIADLVVGLSSGQIKSGAPCRSQRTAKYNQLLRIQQQLGENAIFAGKNFKFPYKLLQ